MPPVVLYEGDPRIFLDEDGSYLDFRGGQPIMDGGLENAVLISLFTRPNWVGNSMFPNTDVHIGSDFLDSFYRPITIGSIAIIQKEALRALDWMVDRNLASEIIVDVVNDQSFKINIVVTIIPPNLPELKLILIKNGINWIIQRDNPANSRFA